MVFHLEFQTQECQETSGRSSLLTTLMLLGARFIPTWICTLVFFHFQVSVFVFVWGGEGAKGWIQILIQSRLVLTAEYTPQSLHALLGRLNGIRELIYTWQCSDFALLNLSYWDSGTRCSAGDQISVSHRCLLLSLPSFILLFLKSAVFRAQEGHTEC